MGTCTREGQSFRYLPGWLGVYQIWRVSCALPPDVAHDPNRPRTSLPSCRRQDLTAHGDDEEEDGELQLGKQRRTWSGRREEDGRHRPLRREEPTEHTAAAPTRASIAPHRTEPPQRDAGLLRASARRIRFCTSLSRPRATLRTPAAPRSAPLEDLLRALIKLVMRL